MLATAYGLPVLATVLTTTYCRPVFANMLATVLASAYYLSVLAIVLDTTESAGQTSEKNNEGRIFKNSKINSK